MRRQSMAPPRCRVKISMKPRVVPRIAPRLVASSISPKLSPRPPAVARSASMVKAVNHRKAAPIPWRKRASVSIQTDVAKAKASTAAR